MKKSMAWILALVLTLTACVRRTDPNLGVYKAKSGTYKGVSVNIEDVLGEVSLELLSGGKAVLRTGGGEYNLRWSLDGESFKLTASDSEYSGTLSDWALTLRNLLNSGMDIQMEKAE